jgi:hypothetical protein
MILVVRDPRIDPSEALQQKLARLEVCRTGTVLADEWPGTILFGSQATVHSFQVTAGLLQGMKALASHLFEWVHPAAPEDPCFFRADGQVLLVTIAHERDAYLMLTDSDSELVQARFPSLASLLRKDA